jgi:lycopene beta-cyclase
MKSMPADKTVDIVDFLFVGAGASATLLLLSMEKNGLLIDKKIVVIDPDFKTKNDKTFCFWTTSTEKPSLLCAPIISHEWNNFRGQNGTIYKEQALSYCMVKSTDLYAEMNRLISTFSISRSYESVEKIVSDLDSVCITTQDQSYQARIVFDSRPPQFSKPQPNETHLYQSFIGYFITCDEKKPAFEAVDLMDFDVAQSDETQFCYVLPFDEHNLLVELTRFGKEVINEECATLILDEYITKRFGSYRILEVERGNIPMSTAKIVGEQHHNVIAIGARSGAIKPSTGYAFKKMMQQAEAISESLLPAKKSFKTLQNKRFELYDRLLLKILTNKPQLGKPIFRQLLSRNSIPSVFRFLDEKSTFIEELKLFRTLPIGTFLSAFVFDMFVSKKKELAALLLVLTTCLLLVLQATDSLLFEWTNNFLLISGFAIIGIPHGAVDHLLTKDEQLTRPTIGFILRYLSSAVLLFLLWMIAPTLSLVLFLLYSSWHFGESDLFQWGIKKNKIVISWLWGIALLSLLLISHISETRDIMLQLGVTIPSFITKNTFAFSSIISIIAFIIGVTTQNKLMILSLIMLLLATQLPLLTAFGLYFIGQHSINSWMHIKKGLKINNKQFFLNAFPFTFGAFLLFGLLIYLVNIEIIKSNNNNLISFFFIFISCISLPHILVIHGFYKRIFNKKELNKQ